MAFLARYEAKCSGCEGMIFLGDNVTMIDTDRGRITVHVLCADGFATGTTPPSLVLPRGKTAADRCSSCFIVHSPGQDGCE